MDEEPDQLFPSDSVLRRINGEALALLGAGRAVLLQIAHPLIAAGVAEYSSFQSDPLARLFRTMRFMDAMLRRDDQREAALRRFHAVHERVSGRLEHAAGPFAKGIPYAGTHPELKLWVHATLIDSSLVAYELFVAPLSGGEREAFYSDCRVLAGLMGVPEDLVPGSLPELRTYVSRTVASDVLTVTPAARDIAHDVLNPSVGPVPAASAALLRFVTAGILPERLQRDFGLPWGPARERLLSALARATRTARPVAPGWLWQSPLRGGVAARWMLGAAFPPDRNPA